VSTLYQYDTNHPVGAAPDNFTPSGTYTAAGFAGLGAYEKYSGRTTRPARRIVMVGANDDGMTPTRSTRGSAQAPAPKLNPNVGVPAGPLRQRHPANEVSGLHPRPIRDRAPLADR